MKKCLIVLILMITPFSAFASNSVHLYSKDNGNIYVVGQDGIEKTVTTQGNSYNPSLSADGRKIIFIKHVKPLPYTSDTGWFPSNHDEIWGMDIDGSNQECIVKNNYSKDIDLKNYLGSFDSLYVSPINGKEKIYFLCQNCATDAILYSANLDGTDVQRITNAHQLNLIGGDPGDEYIGYLVIGQRQSTPERILWKSVLLDPDGNIVFEIDDIDEFWEKHKKL